MNMSEQKFPRPLFGYVVIENPLFGSVKELSEQLSKLPDEQKEVFLREQIAHKFDRCKVLAVGDEVNSIKVGDEVAITMMVADKAQVLSNKEYLYLTERQFFSVW